MNRQGTAGVARIGKAWLGRHMEPAGRSVVLPVSAHRFHVRQNPLPAIGTDTTLNGFVIGQRLAADDTGVTRPKRLGAQQPFGGRIDEPLDPIGELRRPVWRRHCAAV